jgi:hypothetical protein
MFAFLFSFFSLFGDALMDLLSDHRGTVELMVRGLEVHVNPFFCRAHGGGVRPAVWS